MINSYNPLPEIKVVPLTASSQEFTSTQLRRGRPAKKRTALADIHWMKMEEFINSSAGDVAILLIELQTSTPNS